MITTSIPFIFLSNDYHFKTLAVSELRKRSEYNVISTVFDILQAAVYLSRTGPNIIMIDFDKMVVSPQYMKSLCEKHKILVIGTGGLSSAGRVFDGVTQFITKPLSDKDFYIEAFIKDVIRRSVTYLSTASTAAMPRQIDGFMDAVDTNSKIITIASSTGGTEALAKILPDIMPNCPPILIVQHMPSTFTKQFADRLDRISRISVREATSGDYLKKGLALLAPGDLHMKLVKRSMRLAVEVFMGEKMHGVRPAADIMFNSVCEIMPAKTIGVVLTGMGADGARGLKELRNKGAKVIGQDKDSCVVYGMPKAAFDIGAVDMQVPLDRIASKINELANQ